MQQVDLEQILTAHLLKQASEGLTTVSLELALLYDAWVLRGDCPDACSWMRGVLEQLGWWAGRLDSASDPALVAKFPSLD